MTPHQAAMVGRDRAVECLGADLEEDMRFDVLVIGVETVRIADDAKVRAIAVEAGCTLLLEKDAIVDLANRSHISIVAR